MSYLTKQAKVQEIIRRLSKLYPEPKTALDFRSPWELLVATMLSAQTTDKLVNTVTPELFAKYPTVADFATASIEEIDKMIGRVNFHHNKAKSIQGAAVMIMERFRGQIPDNMTDLDGLPGVARKTANVVLGAAFNKPEGIAVDTHVIRLTRLLGLTDQTDPVKIEQELMQIVPRDQWVNFSHYLILYGREHHSAKLKDASNVALADLYI